MALEPTKENVIKELQESKKKIDELEVQNKGLKRALEDATSDKAKFSDQAVKAKAEAVNLVVRASKDKEGLVQQVLSMRAKVEEMKQVQRVASMAKFTRYIDEKGGPTDFVPTEVRGEEDWIGALIESHKALIRARGEWGKYAGIMELHAACSPMVEGCDCPVCKLRREIREVCGGASSLQDRVMELETEAKDLRDECREHRRAAGPASEKAKAKAAAEAKELADAREAVEKSSKDMLVMRKKLQEVESALEREKAKAKKTKATVMADPAPVVAEAPPA